MDSNRGPQHSKRGRRFRAQQSERRIQVPQPKTEYMDIELQPKYIIPKIASDIKDLILTKIGSNVSSVLLYGSSKAGQNYWDVDILVILKENKFNKDILNTLTEIAKEFNEQTLDLQFVYEKEIKSPDLISLDAHGAFFSRILKRAVSLYGVNPFLEYEPSRRQLVVSLVTRIQRYLFHARQEYILGGRHNKDRNSLYHKKHVLRSMFDLLLIHKEWLENDEVMELFVKKYPNVFTIDDWDILGSNSDNVDDYVLLYEKVYNLALIEAYKENI